MADENKASALLGIPTDKIHDFVEYINKMRNLDLQLQQANINNAYSSSRSGATTAQVNTVAANVSKMLGETEDVFGDGSITRAKYDTEDLLAYIESTGLSDEQKYQMEVSFGLI